MLAVVTATRPVRCSEPLGAARSAAQSVMGALAAWSLAQLWAALRATQFRAAWTAGIATIAMPTTIGAPIVTNIAIRATNEHKSSQRVALVRRFEEKSASGMKQCGRGLGGSHRLRLPLVRYQRATCPGSSRQK